METTTTKKREREKTKHNLDTNMMILWNNYTLNCWHTQIRVIFDYLIWSSRPFLYSIYLYLVGFGKQRGIKNCILFFFIKPFENRIESNRIDYSKRDETKKQNKSQLEQNKWKMYWNAHHIIFIMKPMPLSQKRLSHIFDQQIRMNFRTTNPEKEEEEEEWEEPVHTTMNPWWPRPKCRCYFIFSLVLPHPVFGFHKSAGLF